MFDYQRLSTQLSTERVPAPANLLRLCAALWASTGWIPGRTQKLDASFSCSAQWLVLGMAGHQRSRLHKAEQGALVGIATASFTLVIGEDLPAGWSREGCNFLMGFTMVMACLVRAWYLDHLPCVTGNLVRSLASLDNKVIICYHTYGVTHPWPLRCELLESPGHGCKRIYQV